MAGKTIVVLGGGVGGLTASNALRRRLDTSHRVVLVDKRGEHLFAPSLLWLMVGERRPEQLTRDLRTRFEGVYAVGDAATITLANGKPLPKAGVFAHAQAQAVAETLAAELRGGAPARFDGLGYCWVELGAGRAAFAVGDFYAEPNPELRLRTPGRLWHAGKVVFEQAWMGQGVARVVANVGLTLGARALGIPATV